MELANVAAKFMTANMVNTNVNVKLSRTAPIIPSIENEMENIDIINKVMMTVNLTSSIR